MNLSRIIAKRVVKGWKEYNLARDEAQLEYYKEMATIYEELAEKGHADVDSLKQEMNW